MMSGSADTEMPCSTSTPVSVPPKVKSWRAYRRLGIAHRGRQGTITQSITESTNVPTR